MASDLELRGSVLAKVNEFLRTEDDLVKLPSVKKSLMKEYDSLNNSLNLENGRNLNAILNGLNSLTMSESKFKTLMEKVQLLQKYRSQISNSIQGYDMIKKLAQLNENFDEIQSMYDMFSQFKELLDQLNYMIDDELANQIYPDSKVSSLLPIHYELTKLLDFKDKIEKYSLNLYFDDQKTIRNFLGNLDKVVEKFNHLLQEVISCSIESIGENNLSLVIRLVKIIEYEEREDLKLSIVQNLIKEKGDQNKILLKHCTRTQKRDYYDLFLKGIESNIKETFDNCLSAFEDDRFGVLTQLEWVYADLSKVYQFQDQLFPKRWKMFKVVSQLYYKYLNRIITDLIELEPESIIILDILAFDREHQDKMKEYFQIPKEENISIIGKRIRKPC